MAVKRSNKERLARLVQEDSRVVLDPESLFDVQVKRIHEYKRQLLNVLHIVHDYLRLVEDGHLPTVPRTYIFGGKAAPGYVVAKQIIKLINNVGAVVNNDPRVQGMLKVVFIPDYQVSLAERIIPAADLSEQISLAGTEASGTGNMKLAMNGALTIGTLDGANIEILEAVGEGNLFTFGMTTDQVEHLRRDGTYRPRDLYDAYPLLKRVVDAMGSDRFCPREPGIFRGIAESLLDRDVYFLLVDLTDYLDAHERVGKEFSDSDTWATRAILNVARIGRFSSDRTIAEYARDIWHVESIRAQG
jgi:starch phosphorylase